MIKKAQAAVETLMIYGVVMLIVLGAIVALVRMDVFDLGSLFPDNCELDSQKCNSFLVTKDSVQLELKNMFDKNIEKFTINIYGEEDDKGLWGCTETEYNHLVVRGEITNPPVQIPCNIKVPAGKKIKGIIRANITFVGSNIHQVKLGKINAKVS